MLCRNDQVTSHDQFKPATDRKPINCTDNRLVKVPHLG